jgi:hypothetical protein
LRQSIQDLAEAMDNALPIDGLVPLASALAVSLRRCHEGGLEEAHRELDELRAKVTILTSAITAVSSSSHENIRRLRQIKDKILTLGDTRDLRALRLRLGECLDNVLAEAERQHSETGFAATQLQRATAPQPGTPGPGGPAPVELDPATGLATRPHAEESIAQACQQGTPAFVVLMVVNRLETLTQSFGTGIGEAVLGRFASLVRQRLAGDDLLFRWSGPALAALLRRPTNMDTVRRELSPLVEYKLEHTLTTTSGTIQLPINARWTILPIMASPLLLFQKMDAFIAPE